MSPKNEKPNGTDLIPGKLAVKIIDVENGLTVVNNVISIRVRDKEYVLLIMEDYSATIGEVSGEVAILTTDDEIKLEGIKGFYRLRNNEMTLIIHK